MIDHLDTVLFRLLRSQIAALSSDDQVRFQPPDDDWRALVPGITNAAGDFAVSLNVYLFDLRENRRLRSNERSRTLVGDAAFETAPARRVDCHYLISAWSATQPAPATNPTMEEHALLADAAHVLGRNDALDPVALCATTANGLPAIAVPAALRDELLPVTLLPVEGFAKLGEFWGTMGKTHPWKPCVYTVVTIALTESPARAAPLVTSAAIETLRRDTPGSGETFLHIGGSLRASAAAGAALVSGATVELLTAAGVRRQSVLTDALGRFVFVQVSPGSYRLRASAVGLGTFTTAALAIPSPGGGYDVHF